MRSNGRGFAPPCSRWRPSRPRLALTGLAVSWFIGAIALLVAAFIVPGASTKDFGAVVATAAVVAVLNAVLPPLVAALRLPFTLVLGFVLVLVARRADARSPPTPRGRGLRVDSFWWALLAAPRRLRASASCSRSSSARTTTTCTRCASSSGSRGARASASMTDVPGHRLPRDRRPRAAGAAARDARRQRARTWRAGSPSGTHRLAEWETDLSSQTGASQAGILLGSNEDIPAFRWVEKETGDGR